MHLNSRLTAICADAQGLLNLFSVYEPFQAAHASFPSSFARIALIDQLTTILRGTIIACVIKFTFAKVFWRRPPTFNTWLHPGPRY